MIKKSSKFHKRRTAKQQILHKKQLPTPFESRQKHKPYIICIKVRTQQNPTHNSPVASPAAVMHRSKPKPHTILIKERMQQDPTRNSPVASPAAVTHRSKLELYTIFIKVWTTQNCDQQAILLNNISYFIGTF